MTQRLALVGGRGRELPALLDRPLGGGAVRGGIVLAHGAGGTSLTPFIARAGEGLAAAGWAVLRFDFGYATVGGRPSRADRPDTPERVDYRAALAALADALPAEAPIVAAGKSYGGRIATFLVAERADGSSQRVHAAAPTSENGHENGHESGHAASRIAGDGDPVLQRVRAVLVFGYPVGSPDRQRPADVAALRSLGLPILVVQGSRDSLGPLPALQAALAEVTGARIAVIEGGDHSYRAAGGREVVARLEDQAIAAAVQWLADVAR